MLSDRESGRSSFPDATALFRRRDTLKALATGALFFACGLPGSSLSRSASQRRLALVHLRGGLDGLSAAVPYGEPAYGHARTGLALPAPGVTCGALKLDGLFALHPQLVNLHAMFHAGECSVLHATVCPCPERSHLAAQNMTAKGVVSARANDWLNVALESSGVITGAKDARRPWDAAALAVRGLAPTHDGHSHCFVETAKAVGALLCRPGGPSAVSVDIGGWDTHSNQADKLNRNLRLLDQGLAALRASLGSIWRHTAVLVVTEFGRSVAMNHWLGTDHGAASAAFVLGGAVRGGKVIADWPGLARPALCEGSGLRATTDLRSLFKAALIAQFGVSESLLETRIFRDSRSAKPLDGLFG